MYKKNNPNNDFGYKYTQDFIRFTENLVDRTLCKSYNGLVSSIGLALINKMQIQCYTNTIGEYNVSIIR